MNSDSALPRSNSVPKSGISKLWRKLSAGKKSESGRFTCSSPPLTASSDTPRSPLQAVFDFFDEDRNGKISAEELCSCVKLTGGEMTPEEAETAVRSWDADGDGELGFGEFQGMMEGQGAEEEKEKALKEAFGMYASDGKECITPASLRRMLRQLGESKSVGDCKRMIRAFDLNGDGVLSFSEFAVMMR